MKLRIHPRNSPLSIYPQDLSPSLLPLLLAHADGAVKRQGHKWHDFDPLEGSQKGIEPMVDQKFILGRLTWPEAKKRFAETDIALLPVGSLEQHGPHLPLDTDAFDAAYLAEQVASRCTAPKPMVLPLLPYGVSYHHDDFPGTVSITNDTLSRLVYEIGISMARNGVRKLVIINGHGGNIPSLKYAAQMINRDTQIFTCVDTGESSGSDLDSLSQTPNDVHSGEIETSTALATRPELVHMEKAQKNIQKFSSEYLNFSSKRSVEWFSRTYKLSRSGVLGDPTKASAEKGKQIWEVVIKNLVLFVEHLKGLTLEEIYDRKY
jgi:creatinine amidohydrolase/Fe(II)-dependent formamide hydrolase-like protein